MPYPTRALCSGKRNPSAYTYIAANYELQRLLRRGRPAWSAQFTFPVLREFTYCRGVPYSASAELGKQSWEGGCSA